MLDRARSALVLVDYQARLMPVIEGAEIVLHEAVFLGQIAHAVGVPVLGTEQNPKGLGSSNERVRALCERTMAKVHFNAAIDGLTGLLRANGRRVDQVVVAGCESHVCLMQTALGLQQDGLEVFVVPGACGSRRVEDKVLAMQRLSQSGVVLVSGEMVAFEWLRSCTSPQFKDVLKLVKDRGTTRP